MLRRCEDLSHLALLDDAAMLHHADRVGETAHEPEVVRDEQHRHAVGFLKPLEQRENLRLNSDVERGGRLVGDQQIGLVGERHGDHDALTLAARELMRIGAQPRLRIRDADFTQKLNDSVPNRVFAAHAVQFENLRNLPLDHVQRIERGHRLLEHHCDARATNGAQTIVVDREHILAVEQRLAGRDRARGKQAYDRQSADRLAGAGFADERQRLAPLKREGDPVDGLGLVPALPKGDREIANVEEGGDGLRRTTVVDSDQAAEMRPSLELPRRHGESCPSAAA